ncbi:hypothetical protein P175DRAFT_0554217 [Aspergillus ochraceoroseus IBT 24754]|uniref:Uncharacterized protein n=2 Tax=Aspergillus ochraceoroseus TaxID=138278 RepID=A0A2T5M8U8_9EURO|nr:uncharacterized protein P175DRAFT_0554217 [Aspergillus ochraceoroseus IBT 24754]PTU24960.1 hypothetical protein P175DRAFT_0554217 [Aspergillus ochraceoroseus IBT 24754]
MKIWEPRGRIGGDNIPSLSTLSGKTMREASLHHDGAMLSWERCSVIFKTMLKELPETPMKMQRGKSKNHPKIVKITRILPGKHYYGIISSDLNSSRHPTSKAKESPISPGTVNRQNGVNFPERNLKSLESFFGVGSQASSRLLARFYIHPTCKVGELANKQVLDLTAALSDMKIENDLRRQYLDDIKRLKETGTYRGRRHALGLPVRGQRTRSQIQTAVKLNRMERRL